MDKMECTTAEREALQYGRFHQPPPRVQHKMEALYLQSQGLTPEAIRRLCAISHPTFSRSLHADREGGSAQLHEVPLPRRQSPWAAYRTRMEAAVRPRPPASVAAAAARIAALTGLQRGPTQVRQCFKSLGMQLRKVGQMPAKAAGTAQEDFQTEQREPRWAEATSGQRVVCFLEAAHVVFAPFLGLVWGCERRFVKAPRGRQRLNVLAALNATTRDICTVSNLPSITSATVCEGLRLLAGAHPGVPRTMVLDHARSPRCALVQSLAQRLAMELLFLPASSPNLHLIERFWKCVKKPWLYAKDSADHRAFQQAIIACMEQAPDKHQEALTRLLTLKFQSFKAVQVIGEEANVSLFPIARRAQRKVSSIAA